MAIFNLQPSAWTPILADGRTLIQAQKGLANIAGSDSPAVGDWINLAAGDMLVIEAGKYARGVGVIVTQEI